MSTKFSQFNSGGTIQQNDIVVGLRSSTDTQFNFPGSGINDQYGNYLIGWITAGTGSAVATNYISFGSALTGNSPYISSAGTDTNPDLLLTTQGSGIINLSASGGSGFTTINNSQQISSISNDSTLSENSQNILPTQYAVKQYITSNGTVNSGLINQLGYYSSSGTTISGLVTQNNGILTTNGSGSPSWVPLSAGQILIGTTGNAPSAAAINSGTNVIVGNSSGSITIGTIASPVFTNTTLSGNILDQNGNILLGLGSTASAVNYYKIINNSTGGAVIMQAAGSDTNITANFQTKGTGNFQFSGNPSFIQAWINNVTPANYLDHNISSLSTNRIVAWPDASGTVILSNASGQGIITSPASSNTATTAFGSSLTAGTPVHNTLGYNILLNICVSITSSTTATLTLGVGSTSTPTVNTVIPSFSTASAITFTFSAIVPNGYYVLVNSTGTIVISSITCQSCPL